MPLFMALIAKYVSDDMVNVFAGTDVKVPCFPTGGIHLLASDTDDVKYKWTHQHDKPISGNTKRVALCFTKYDLKAVNVGIYFRATSAIQFVYL